MKFLKLLIALLIVAALIIGIIKIKDSFSGILNKETITEGFNTLMQNIKGIDSGDIKNNLSGKIEEAKGLAEQYYNDVLKEYVDKAKVGVSGAVENAKGYYNQGIDNLGETITNKINSKVEESLDKIKVK